MRIVTMFFIPILMFGGAVGIAGRHALLLSVWVLRQKPSCVDDDGAVGIIFLREDITMRTKEPNGSDGGDILMLLSS